MQCNINGDTLREVKKILIKAPNGKKSELKNTFGFNELTFKATDISYEEFQKKFPAGEYSFIFLPKKTASITVDVPGNFPSTPVITYPEDGATDVTLPLTIECESLEQWCFRSVWLSMAEALSMGCGFRMRT